MDIATFHASRRFAEVKSGRIAYFERGEGPVALFVHGVPLNGYHWRYIIDRVHHAGILERTLQSVKLRCKVSWISSASPRSGSLAAA
jgi:hypothetical protein